MSVSTPIGGGWDNANFNGIYPSQQGWGQTTSYGKSTKKTVTTVTEYDKEGRVVKTTVTEETVDTTPSYPYTWNNDKFYITNVGSST